MRQKPYPIPIQLADTVKRDVEDMESVGIIEKSTSPFCSPTVDVQKIEVCVYVETNVKVI